MRLRKYFFWLVVCTLMTLPSTAFARIKLITLPVRERVGWYALLLLVGASFVWRPTVLLWHGLAIPNGSPYRAAFVLCVLQGKSGPEAAAELGVREGTVWSRLTRARHLLRQRLVRRGIELSAVLAAVSVAESTGQATVPAALAVAALRCGLSTVAGGMSAGQIPSPVAALAAGVTRAMLLTRAKIPVIILLYLTHVI